MLVVWFVLHRYHASCCHQQSQVAPMMTVQGGCVCKQPICMAHSCNRSSSLMEHSGICCHSNANLDVRYDVRSNLGIAALHPQTLPLQAKSCQLLTGLLFLAVAAAMCYVSGTWRELFPARSKRSSSSQETSLACVLAVTECLPALPMEPLGNSLRVASSFLLLHKTLHLAKVGDGCDISVRSCFKLGTFVCDSCCLLPGHIECDIGSRWFVVLCRLDCCPGLRIFDSLVYKQNNSTVNLHVQTAGVHAIGCCAMRRNAC